MKADLHIHSIFSDGEATPEAIVQTAAHFGFDVIAIADHDTVDSMMRATLEGENYGVTVIPAVELSCVFDDEEVHILGYDIDDQNEELIKVLESCAIERRNRIYKMVDALAKLHMNITANEIFDLAGNGSLGRPHVAKAMIQKGYVQTFSEAFQNYLIKGKPAYVPKHRMTVEEAIGLIHHADGVAVIAHPGSISLKTWQKITATLPIDGLEVYHHKNDEALKQTLLKVATEKDLLVTGGSDFHGYLSTILPKECPFLSIDDTTINKLLKRMEIL